MCEIISVSIPMAEGAKSLVRKISISPTSSWITFDSKGQSSILNVDKYGIMRRVQINARDLRILDSLLSYPSTILSREDFIVLNLEVNIWLNSCQKCLFYFIYYMILLLINLLIIFSISRQSSLLKRLVSFRRATLTHD